MQRMKRKLDEQIQLLTSTKSLKRQDNSIMIILLTIIAFLLGIVVGKFYLINCKTYYF